MIETISAGVGLVSGVASMFGGRDNSAQVAAQAYQNTLSQRRTEIMNAYRQRAYERQVEQVQRQLDENYAAANASFQTEQAKFAEQMMAFAFQKEGMLRQLDQVEGYAAATESYGKSADRMKAIKTLGDYGRNRRKFVESVASAQRQYGRNLGGIARAAAQATMSTVQPILGGGPIPEIVPEGAPLPYSESGGFFNTAMKIMGGVQTGLSAYQQFDTAFNPNSVFNPNRYGGGGSTGSKNINTNPQLISGSFLPSNTIG